MRIHENRLPADDSHEISCLKTAALNVIFERAVKFEDVICCRSYVYLIFKKFYL